MTNVTNGSRLSTTIASETNGHLYIANDNLKRIADALETIIKMVKQDQDAVAAYRKKQDE